MDKKDNANGISRKDIAMQNFLKGYNCTQSVLLAFEDLLPVENRKEIICMASYTVESIAEIAAIYTMLPQPTPL